MWIFGKFKKLEQRVVELNRCYDEVLAELRELKGRLSRIDEKQFRAERRLTIIEDGMRITVRKPATEPRLSNGSPSVGGSKIVVPQSGFVPHNSTQDDSSLASTLAVMQSSSVMGTCDWRSGDSVSCDNSSSSCDSGSCCGD